VPDQNVNLSFDPNANPQFEFDRDTVTMTAAGKVIFHRRPSTAEWTFRDGAVKDDKLKEFSSTVQGNGKLLDIDDKFYDRQKTSYEYNITVELHGTTYTSPDPHIVNDPGP